MRIGASTSCFYPMETEKAVDTLIESGFKSIEIFFNSFSELEIEFLEKIRKRTSENDCEIVSIHPFLSGVEPFLIFSNYERRFYDTVNFYEKFYKAAQFLGAKKLIIHGGVFPDKYKLSDEEYCRRFAILAERGEQFGIETLHENVNKFRASTPEFINVMNQIIPERAKFTLDIKQAVRSGENPFEILEAMGKGLKHIHINDHTNDKDCLLPLCGSFDYMKFFMECKKIGYDGDFIIEVYRTNFNDVSEISKSAINLSKMLLSF